MKIKKLSFIVIIILIIGLFFYSSYNITLTNLPPQILNILEYRYQKEKNNIVKIDILSLIINSYHSKNYFVRDSKKNIKLNIDSKEVLYVTNTPIVYIYNTHSNEEYSYTKNDIYNITPTVMTAAHILESELKKLGIESIVETNNTINIINERGLPYSSSYKVSREFLEQRIKENPSLIYFIDLHRDSVSKKITTTTINGVSYAKTMFLLGLENENYLKNKKMMNYLNDYLNTNFPGLSRGIYEKKGKGVNGVYNQDFNEKTILIEVGGIDNTIDEVANSLKIIANSLSIYIENDQKDGLS